MAENPGPRILVVDDEPEIARSLKKLLEKRLGAAVDVATSADEARGKLAAGYDVVTLDYQMTDCDGLTLLKEFRTLGDAPPVVMVTGHGDEETAVAAFNEGASGYVVKDPRMPELLTDAVNKAVLQGKYEAVRRQREVLAALLDGVTDAVIARDSDMRITYWNRGAEQMYGISADEAVGRISSELIETGYPPGTTQGEAIRSLKETGSFRGDLIHYANNRPHIIADVTAWTVTDPRGNTVAHISINRDVTLARRLEERTSKILDRLPDAVLVVDAAGTVLYMNEAMRDMFGMPVPAAGTLDDLRGDVYISYKTGTDIPYPLDEAPIGRAMRGEAATVDDVEMEAGGRRIPLEVTAAPILGPDGEVEYAVAVSKDISERKKAEETLRAQVALQGRIEGLYSVMEEGLAIHELVYDDGGRPVDYRITKVNPSYTSITGLTRDEAEGRLASELYGTGEAPYLDIYAGVAATGEPATFEVYFPPMEKHFRVSVFSPDRDVFATVFTDISEQKEAERPPDHAEVPVEDEWSA